MRHLPKLLLAVLLAGAAAQAADLYVAKDRGDNSNPGTKEAPFKNIESALKAAKAGDRILVARGNYTGLRDKGYLEAAVPVELIGGYTSDFSGRDPVRNPTTVIPDNESAGTGRKPLLTIASVPAGSRFVLDGFILDRGAQNAYSAKDGLVKGLGGRLLMPTEKPADGNSTVAEPLVAGSKSGGVIEGDVVIQNCVFLNGHFGIQLGVRKGTIRILNNVFAGNTMAAVEIFGKGGKKGPKGPIEKDGHVEVANNTILFTWSRTKELGDMGYGVRVMTMLSYDIRDNIIGHSVLTGIDHSRGNLNEWLKIDNNILFGDRVGAPMTYVEPGTSATAKLPRVKIGDMNADLGLASCKGNTADLGGAALPLNKTYAEAFQSVKYDEKTQLDRQSSANVARQVHGQNMQGTMTSSVTMFANRYPMEDALKLFGAKAGKGAQAVK